MTRFEEIIYSVLYDRLHKWQQPKTTLEEISNETFIDKNTVNVLLFRLKDKGFVSIKRGNGIEIKGVKNVG